MSYAFGLLFLLFACKTDLSGVTTCEACLEKGGTWQPEADSCNRGCDLQDISCFRDTCPGACEAGACDNCFDQTTCEAASCVWNIENEAAWCNSTGI